MFARRKIFANRRVFLCSPYLICVCLCFCTAISPNFLGAAEPIKIAKFNVEVTPKLGTPVAYAPATKILDPLFARGVVILSDEKPVVLCAVDWIGISNESLRNWKAELAKAAKTSADRVNVHALHQHDGPRADLTSEALLESVGLGGRFYDKRFGRKSIAMTCDSIRKAIETAVPVTHMGLGQAKIEKVASNRRILGDDGKVKIVRFSRTTSPAAIAAPEGVIDPFVKIVSFWNGEKPIVALSYYATHPQSYYGDGEVTSEFIGLARAEREKETGLTHIHFNGAGGNVAAGKYNDGSKANRPVLTSRVSKGLKLAWENTKKNRVDSTSLEYRTAEVSLPVGKHLEIAKLQKMLNDKTLGEKKLLEVATHLAWALESKSGRKIGLSNLRIGDATIFHMPGELFVEYQLAAQKMNPNRFTCMAAYGEYGCGYIGTNIAYSQGGYETSNRASRVGPKSEEILLNAIKELSK